MQSIDLWAELTWSININMYNNIIHPDWVYQQSLMVHNNYKYKEYKMVKKYPPKKPVPKSNC